MKIHTSDFLLVRFAEATQRWGRRLGDWETNWLREELNSVAVRQPVFITGLARAGTTVLLELFAQMEGVATHRYRDFPFLATPYLWNRCQDVLASEARPTERAHRDRILVTAESPEAFEEPLWQMFFPHVHSAGAVHRLRAEHRERGFDKFFHEHLLKLLWLRGGTRYVSKGNYNISRLEYLIDLFPDAWFVVPVRHPFAQVSSLIRMHALFTEYAQRDPRVPRYLAAAGHYEFGPQRVPICLQEGGAERVQDAWSKGHQAQGYAMQWADVYGHLNELRQQHVALAERTLVVSYEQFCRQPRQTMDRILTHACLNEPAKLELDHIGASNRSTELSAQDQAAVWGEVAEVAREFGYDRRHEGD